MVSESLFVDILLRLRFLCLIFLLILLSFLVIVQSESFISMEYKAYCEACSWKIYAKLL